MKATTKKELTDRYAIMWHALNIANLHPDRMRATAELAIDQWLAACEAQVVQTH